MDFCCLWTAAGPASLQVLAEVASERLWVWTAGETAGIRANNYEDVMIDTMVLNWCLIACGWNMKEGFYVRKSLSQRDRVGYYVQTLMVRHKEQCVAGIVPY